MEWLYRRCLEILERHETNTLASKSFESIWINTDKLQYNLNNVRKKGQGGKRYDNVEDKHLQTHIVVSCDIHSRYVFRSDIAYDWNIGLSEVEADASTYMDDHLDDFSRKNGTPFPLPSG